VLVIVVVGLKLGVELVPAIQHNMPPIVVDLTLGAVEAAVVPTATTVIAAIIMEITGLATSVAG
jgi:hypothetical protein